MSAKRVLSVGQCQADHGNLSHTLRKLFSAEVVPVASAAEAERLVGKQTYDLVLVNRVLDADGTSGLDLIQRLKQASPAPVMLVSNFEDAQSDAVAAGALPGFGKAALGQPALLDCLRAVLAG